MYSTSARLRADVWESLRYSPTTANNPEEYIAELGSVEAYLTSKCTTRCIWCEGLAHSNDWDPNARYKDRHGRLTSRQIYNPSWKHWPLV